MKIWLSNFAHMGIFIKCFALVKRSKKYKGSVRGALHMDLHSIVEFVEFGRDVKNFYRTLFEGLDWSIIFISDYGMLICIEHQQAFAMEKSLCIRTWQSLMGCCDSWPGFIVFFILTRFALVRVQHHFSGRAIISRGDYLFGFYIIHLDREREMASEFVGATAAKCRHRVQGNEILRRIDLFHRHFRFSFPLGVLRLSKTRNSSSRKGTLRDFLS